MESAESRLPPTASGEWIGKGSAIGQAAIIGLMGLYSLVIFGLHPGWLLAVRVATVPVWVWGSMLLVAKGSLIVGPHGIRQIWPSRISARWDEVAGAEAVTERRLGHPNGVRPVIHLRDGRSFAIQLGSKRGGTATKLIDAVNDGVRHAAESHV